MVFATAGLSLLIRVLHTVPECENRAFVRHLKQRDLDVTAACAAVVGWDDKVEFQTKVVD